MITEWSIFRVAASFSALSITYLSLHVLFLSMRMAAFYEMIYKVLPEIGKFLLLALMSLYGFAAAMTVAMTSDPHTKEVAGDMKQKHSMSHLSYMLFNGWLAQERTLSSDLMRESHEIVPPLALAFLTGYGVFMSVLFLRLLTAQLSTSYARLLNETQGFAVLSAASFVLQLEAGLHLSKRQKLYDELKFDQRLPFEGLDMGVPGGVQVREPLHKWPIVETDRVIRFTGAAGRGEPWPVPPQEITLEERLIGIDTRIRQTMTAFENGIMSGVGRGMTAGSMRGSRLSLQNARKESVQQRAQKKSLKKQRSQVLEDVAKGAVDV